MNHHFSSETPLVRVYILILLGTILATRSLLPIQAPVLIGALLACWLLIVSIRQAFRLHLLPRQVMLSSLLIYPLLFLIGFSRGWMQEHQLQEHLQIQGQELNTPLVAAIQTKPVAKKKTYQVIARLCPSKNSGCFNALLYLSKKSIKKVPDVGDRILIPSIQLKAVQDQKNPYAFDYKDYLYRQGIVQTAFVQDFEYLPPDYQSGINISKHFSKLQTTLVGILRDALPNPATFSIAKALLLGEKSEMKTALRTIFQQSGAMHILAVSGLHVGIIYLLLAQLLFFLPKKSIAKSILLIAGVVCYAVITGASPSVLRASSMLAMLSSGLALKRHINIYNILAASACVLSLINPFIIYNIGFQLSYAALISILYFYKKIYRLYIPNSWLLDKIWQLSAVSLAAQIGTLPLTLYYFHQFPVYFLLSNLIAIPLATLIIYTGVGLFIFQFIPAVKEKLAQCLSILLDWLITSLQFIAELPFAISTGWTPNFMEVIGMYLVLICIMTAISFREKRMIFPALALILMLSINRLISIHQSANQGAICVYFDAKTSCLLLKDGLQCKVYSSNSSSSTSLQELILLYANHQHASNPQMQNLLPGTNLFSWQDLHFAYLLSSPPVDLVEYHFDFVVLGQFTQMDFENLFSHIKATHYIFDGTNNPYLYEDWKKSCLAFNQSCIFLKEQGAFVYEIP